MVEKTLKKLKGKETHKLTGNMQQPTETSNYYQFDRTFREQCAVLETAGLDLMRLGRELSKKREIICDKYEGAEEEKNRAIKSYEDLMLKILNLAEGLTVETVIKQGEKDPSKVMEQIQSALIEFIKREGVTEIPIDIGKVYDPQFCEAVEVPIKKEVPGTVLGILSPGYKYKGKVLRATKVQVSTTGDGIEQ